MKYGVIVGGAQLDELAREQGAVELCADLQTPWGDASGPVLKLKAQSNEVYLLARHGADRGLNPHAINYRANVWQLGGQGVDCILGTHTVGSIDPQLDVGDLIFPEQLIDYTWGRPSIYDDQRRHIEFSNPYSAALQAQIREVDPAILLGGTYGCTQGPRLETAAEIRRMANDGCSLVGMTGMPEAALARELEIDYASLCLVVNPAAGIAGDVIDLEDIYRVSAAGADRIWIVIQGLLAHG